MIDTKAVTRRELSFETLEDALDEAHSLVETGAEVSGNWSFPQLLEHLARSIDANVDGVNAKFSLPMRLALWPVRNFFGPKILAKVIRDGMPAGQKLPKVLQPQFFPSDDPDLAESLEHYRQAVERLRQAERLPPHPVFGEMSVAMCRSLHCRHAELHLGFARPSV